MFLLINYQYMNVGGMKRQNVYGIAKQRDIVL